jgi:dTDP-4-dehydrorhamnose 3,5-epimerase-like enzyme
MKLNLKKINLNEIKIKLKGSITVAEYSKQIPFLIKRFYLLHNTPLDTIRGRHAHKKTKIVLICLTGKCKVTIFKNSERNKTFILSNQKTALFINNKIFKEIKFLKEKTMLAVLASEKYSKRDYMYE